MRTLRCGPAIRRWLIAAALLLLPLALYHDTIAAHYGLRDDYSILRESHEEPGKVSRWCASQGRPLYGLVLESSFGRLDGIDDLRVARALAATLVGVVALLAHLALRRAGWAEAPSLAFAALLAVLPAAQVDVSWAVCFPHVIAAAMGLGAFLVSDAGGWRRIAGGVALVACGALFYQPHVLVYAVPLAAGVMARRDLAIAARARWLAPHLATLAAGLLLALAIVSGLFASGVVEPSHLWALDAEPLAKLRWFVAQPLRDALALIALRDGTRAPSPFYAAMVVGVGAGMLFAVAGEWRLHGPRAAGFAALCIVGLVVVSFGANLIASEKTPKYRTLWALGGVCAVFAAQGLAVLAESWPRIEPRAVPVALALLAIAGVPLAHSQAYELIARPQGQELALVEQAVRTPLLHGEPAVFVIRPGPGDTLAPLRFEDEFGSLSSDSDWVPAEMAKAVIEERAPSLCGARRLCRIATGRSVPPGRRYDLVIDMRRLRDLRGREAASHG